MAAKLQEAIERLKQIFGSLSIWKTKSYTVDQHQRFRFSALNAFSS